MLITEEQLGQGAGVRMRVKGHSQGEQRPILIVDDNQTLARALARLLNNSGYGTRVFHQGGEALEWARANDFAAAVIDIHLPDISGLIVSHRLRAARGPAKPIIIVSGDTSMENLNSLSHVGATYFFSKPMRSSQLVQQLRELVA